MSPADAYPRLTRPRYVPAMPELLDKRLVIVTGKGGVGKSTVALALGLAAAARGRRTIVCEVSSQEHTSRVFHRAEVGFHEVEMADNLWAISIDPDEAMREYVLLQLKVRAMRDLLFRSRIFSYLTAATPGLRELVTIDAPATGYGVGFLQTPRTFANLARVGPIKVQAAALEAFIVNHRKTGAAIVALPEEMPVNETADLSQRLSDDLGMEIDQVVANAVLPKRFTAHEVRRLRQNDDRGTKAAQAAIAAALVEHRRAEGQQEQLERLRGAVSAPVVTLPYLFEPEPRRRELELLSDLLEEAL
jgi:anion-transporting  ArsA/GET3 family ATPase